MANKVVEFGIRIAVDGQQATPEIERIDTAAKKMAASVEQAGRAMATEFTTGTEAVAKSADAVVKMAESEEAATARIKAMVAASREQTAALDAESRAAELSAVSTRRYADENTNLAASLARASAQMSAQSAHTTGAGAGNVASEESQRFVANLQRQYDMLGKNAAELAQYEAKMLGGTRATQAQAGAIASNTEALRNMIAAEERQGAAADNFIARLKEQTATVGMSRSQLLAHQAAQLGVTQEAAPLIARFTEASEAAKKHADDVSKATKGHHEFSFSTAQSKKELIVLAHELSQNRFSNFGGSLMVLAEQTGAASFLFSGMGLAILAAAAAVAGLGYAVIKGGMEQREMNNALILTGNYAGMTADSLNALAHSAVEMGGTVGAAKHAVTELAASGKFTGTQIGYITEAVVALEHGAGVSIEKTIKQFESLAVQSMGSTTRATEVISRATLKLDDQYHFLTEAVYEEIRALEKEGDAKGASARATEEFARVVNDRSHEMVANLGSIAKGWHEIRAGVSAAVDAVGNWGKRATPGSNVGKYSFQLQQFDSGLAESNERLGRAPDAMSASLAESRMNIVRKLTAAVTELNKVDAEANAEGARQLVQSTGEHAASRVLADDQRLQKRGLGELRVALDGYYEDIKKIKEANPDSVLVTPEAVAAHVKALTAAHSNKPKAAKADAADNIELADQMARIQDYVNAEKTMIAQLGRMDDLFHSAGKMGDEEYYKNKIDYAQAVGKEEIDGYARQITALRAHHNLTEAEEAKHAKQISDLTAKSKAAQQKTDDDVNLLGAAEFLRQEAVVSASDDAMNKYISSLSAEADKIDAANVGREESRGAIERETAALLDLAIASQKQFIGEQTISGATEAEIEQAPKILKYLEDQRTARLRLADGLDRQDVDKGLKKAAERAIQDWKYVGTSIAESLSSAFGAGGKAIGGMVKAYSDAAARQVQISKDLAEATKGRADTDPEKFRLASVAQRESARAQVKSYGDITSAAKGYFKEGTAGYKVLQTTERAFRTVEMAMAVQSMVQSLAATSTKTTAVVAGKGFESAAMIGAATVDTATTGVSVANSVVKTTASTIAGVAKSFEQLGVWGFVGAAAIIAFMAGMGSSMSGGGGSVATTFEERQKTQGTGTVLGDSTAKSESMAHSLDIMEKNSSLELGYQNSMLTALRNIESALGGAAKGLFQTAGLTAGSAFGTVNSSTKSFFGSDKSTTITDTGVKFNGSLGALRSGAASGIQYEDVTKTSDGGWFHGNSSKKSTNTLALSAAAMKPFTLIFDNMGALLVDAGVKLGADGKALNNAINSVVIDFAVSTRDLKGQDLIDALSAGVSVAFDTVTTAVYPQIAEFQKVGEGLGETLVRVASNYTNLDAIMRSIGATFGAVGMSSLAAREYLIDLVGGLDKLQSQTEAFATDFLSEAERLAPVSKMVTEQMAALGLAGVKTRDQYKDVVLDLAASGKLATDAGAKQYAALLALAPEFAKVYPAAEDAVEAAKKITDAWQSVTDSIVDEIRRIRGLLGTDSTQSYAAAQASFAIATAKARAGDQEAAASLPDLSQAMLSLAESQAHTALELAVIRGQTAASLENTAATAVKYGVKVPGFASGGEFGGGLRLVGENGPELEVTGPSRIYNAMQTSAMLSGGDNTELIVEMRQVRRALEIFAEQSQDGDIAIAQNTGLLARLAQRWDGAGLPVRSESDSPLTVVLVGS